VPSLDTLLRRNRAIVGATLLVTALAAWLYLFHLSATVRGRDTVDMALDAVRRKREDGYARVVRPLDRKRDKLAAVPAAPALQWGCGVRG